MGRAPAPLVVLALHPRPSCAVAPLPTRRSSMEMTRDRFVAQFAIAFHVHCLKMWRTRRREAPTFITTCLHEWIRVAGGRMALEGADFSALARPVVEELHRRLAKEERPNADLLAGLIYDMLEQAGVEVTLSQVSDKPMPDSATAHARVETDTVGGTPIVVPRALT
jgi:hypothetical protein